MSKMEKLLWVGLLVFMSLAFTAAPALAAGPLNGRVIFGEDFTLEAGDVLDGDLVVFSGSVMLERDSRVEGDVAVLGGSANVFGSVDGDMVIFGGSVDLGSTAVIEGELIAFGGDVDRAEGAVVRGNVVEGLQIGQDFRIPAVTKVWNNGYQWRWDHWLLRFFWRAFQALAAVVLITVIGALVTVFMPQSVERVSQAVLVAPVHSWLVGFVSAILAVLIGGLLIATLCLSPFGAVVWLGLLVTSVFGWIALGLIVGLKVLNQLKVRDVTPVKSTIVGTAILSLLAAAIGILSACCLGWPFIVVVGSFGLGAVVLTRFGTQEYVPSPETALAPQLPVAMAEDEGEFVPAEAEEATPDPESDSEEEPAES